MADATKPNYNPADSLTAEGKDNFLMKTLKMGFFCAAPGIVEQFDRASARAVIRPAFMAKKSNGESLEQDLLYNVPVRFSGGGGFAASLPLIKGDTGWLIFCDRDLSIFKQTRKVSPLNTCRMHAPEDAFFLPDAMQSNNVAGADSGKAVFQTLNGQTKITMAPGTVELLGDFEITGDVTITGDVKATGDVEITGDVNITGEVVTTGTITAAVDVIGGGISLKNHVHGGVSGGPSDTGVPK